MKERYRLSKNRAITFPRQLLDSDFETIILVREKGLKEKYELTFKQIKSLVSFKPSTILYEEEYEKNKNGIKAVHKVFVKELGFK